MKFIILGAGWYGNFAGLLLKKLNVDFIILEKQNDIFRGSSSKNQNRLHQGYHYPRSQNTRDECIYGYNMFTKLFNFMTYTVKNNYYLIEKKSNISFQNYIQIYNHLNFSIVNDLNLNMDNIEGIIKCDEKLINHNNAYHYFKKMLCDHTIR
jgi:L-2-hydroxyglutarate oxidase LhgO